ncbi:response regulator [Cohnella hashimotonis]|uniref:Response regulator transcription factor n=1 Tax=Cohnella hashimotonis TaxID=2826895 RepID=A0ABT6TSM4_9BACL|nr:response regulator transcription factor [Cohnella hashimotonis]MDI4649856.1 response regulator transcription factor [Cohnella hashimotonis]
MHSVVIADDRDSARTGLYLLLAGSGAYRVLGQASDGDEALALAGTLRPQLLVTDLKMPGLPVIEVARRLKEGDPSIKIVILTAYDDCEDIYLAAGAGVDGYLMKDTDPEEILAAIGQVMEGRVFFQARENASGVGREMRETP